MRISQGPLSDSAPFRILFIGQALALVGNRIALVMLPVAILITAGSAQTAGLVEAVIVIVFLTAQLPAGLLVDRFDRRVLMFGADMLSALAMASLLVASLRGSIYVVHYAVAGAVLGGTWAITRTAEMASAPQFVGDTSLSSAVSAIQARTYIATLVGAPVGGLLLAISSGAPFGASGLLFVASTGFTAVVRHPVVAPTPSAQQERKKLLIEIRRGLALVTTHPFIRRTVTLVTCSDLVLQGLGLLLVTQSRFLGGTSAEVGVALAIGATGGLLGAVVTPFFLRLGLRPGTMTWVAPVVTAVAVGAIPLAPSPWLLGVLYGLAFAPWPLWNGLIASRWLLLVPPAVRGRLHSAATLILSTAVPTSPVLVGWLLDSRGPTTTVAVLCVPLLTVGIAAWTMRRSTDAAANISEGTDGSSPKPSSS